MNPTKKTKLITTIGYDPEVMLYSKAEERIVSALPVLKNDKKTPIELGDGIKMYADNVLVEAAAPASETPEEALGTLRKAILRMRERLGADFSLLPKAAHLFDKDQMDDKKAWEIGCSPNFCAYTGAVNDPKPFSSTLRTGSFHIHIGNADWEKCPPSRPLMNPISKMQAIRVLDIVLGCASVIFDKDPTSVQRRAIYGKAGEFRPTPYGIEYRVLGNYALRTPRLSLLAMQLAEYAMGFMRDGTAGDLVKAVSSDLVREAINTASPGKAALVLEYAKVPPHLMTEVLRADSPDFATAW